MSGHARMQQTIISARWRAAAVKARAFGSAFAAGDGLKPSSVRERTARRVIRGYGRFVYAGMVLMQQHLTVVRLAPMLGCANRDDRLAPKGSKPRSWQRL